MQTTVSQSQVIDEIFERFRQRGHQMYGESVTELQHALQCATAAERELQPASMIVAALLHDIGHLIHGLGENIADRDVDALHEDLGAEYLAGYFPHEIVAPVQMHVAAKRYLCTVEDNYLERLSPASRKSFELQGGRMSPKEIADFAASPHFAAAVQLRRYDDFAKDTTAQTPHIEHFRPYLERVLRETNPDRHAGAQAKE